MELHVDLHAHSAFAGGARAGGKTSIEQEKRIRKRFVESAIYSPLKGVNLLGSGDAQFEPWLKFLESHLEEQQDGIFKYSFSQEDETLLPKGQSIDFSHQPEYILQSEVIFTGPAPNAKRKKKAHIVLLFPNFQTVHEFNNLLDTWAVARQSMARPFIVCDSVEQVEQRTHDIFNLHPQIEFIPAHVMTPEGVYGGNERVNRMKQFFGSASDRIQIVETGLSADPDILGLIPELDKRTLISNADAHSSALNRVGREFTSINLNKISYRELIRALRLNKISKTAEFHPTEGRYFLTGHRPDRKQPKHEKHEYCIFSPKYVPEKDTCPICKKNLTIGVYQRALEACRAQGKQRVIGDGPKRPFVTMVPLIEILAFTLNIKSVSSKRLFNEYQKVIKIAGSEVKLWTNNTIIRQLQNSNIGQDITKNILEIKNGNFCFSPAGYDGTYGRLVIGEREDYNNISIIKS